LSRLLRALVAALAVPAAGCGYHLAGGWHAAGAERVHVRPFQPASADPGLAAAFTTALREELARRGADAGDDAPAWLEGEVRAGEGMPSTEAAATYHVVLDGRARLWVKGAVAVDRPVRREGDYLAGADALETEGRRALALRRLAAEAAADLVQALAGVPAK
jgi:hypothetical protein